MPKLYPVIAIAVAAALPAAAEVPLTAPPVDMVKMTTGDRMALHGPMPGMPIPPGRKLTPAERQKRHEAMMRLDALRAAAIRSAMPP